jgi:hypothetical protein
MNFMTAHHFPSARPFPDAISRGLGPVFKKYQGIAGLEHVTLSSTVTQPRPNLAQIATLADRFAAKPTETLPERHPAVDQNEFHVAPPRAKQ